MRKHLRTISSKGQISHATLMQQLCALFRTVSDAAAKPHFTAAKRFARHGGRGDHRHGRQGEMVVGMGVGEQIGFGSF